MNDITKRYASRKFWAMVLFQLIFVALRWYDKLPVEAFVSLSYVVIGGYFIANVTEGVMKPKADAQATLTQVEALKKLQS